MQRISLTPPVPVPSPDQKGGGLCVRSVTPPRKTVDKHLYRMHKAYTNTCKYLLNSTYDMPKSSLPDNLEQA